MASVKIAVIYHDNCSDGAASAWAITHLAAPHPVSLHPANPGAAPAELPPADTDLVFIADTVVPDTLLHQLNERARLGAWVLDHHATNQAQCDAYAAHCKRAFFDLKRSGVGLSWDEGGRILHELKLRDAPPPPRPWLVNYVEDRDLWRFALPDSADVNAAVSSRERTPAAMAAIWAETLAAGEAATVAAYLAEGRVIARCVAETVATALRAVCAFEIGGVAGWAVSSPVHQSEIGAALAKQRGAVAAVWCVKPAADGAGLVAGVSLRSRDELPDCSRLAKSLGGGGHRNAAGCTVPLATWVAALRPTV